MNQNFLLFAAPVFYEESFLNVAINNDIYVPGIKNGSYVKVYDDDLELSDSARLLKQVVVSLNRIPTLEVPGTTLKIENNGFDNSFYYSPKDSSSSIFLLPNLASIVIVFSTTLFFWFAAIILFFSISKYIRYGTQVLEAFPIRE